MTKTKVAALIVAVVGSFLFFKTIFFPPTKAWEMYNKAGLAAYGQGNYAEAEKQLAVALREAEKFSPESPHLTLSLNNMVELYKVQAKYAESEPYIKRLLSITEKRYGPEHPNVAANLINLAANYRERGMYQEAEPLYKRALEIWEKALGREDPLVIFALKGYADLLYKMGRVEEAQNYEARTKPHQAKPPSENPIN